jgi:hypothetical protein
VPKKFGLSFASASLPKNVVSVPSVQQMSGLPRSMAVAKRVPSVENSTGVPPALENASFLGTVTNGGESRYHTAPTAIAPAAFAWPLQVDDAVSNSVSVMALLNQTNFNRPAAGPAKWLTRMS